MPLTTLTTIQTIVWIIAGSAAIRLWESPNEWVVWTLIPLLIFEVAVSATLKRVQAGESDLVKTAEDRETFGKVWTTMHRLVWVVVAGFGLYGHTLV